MAGTETARPLVIFGIDGGDWRLITQWAGEGRLPAIASVMERGCWARTSGLDHVCEHGTGLTMLSGVSRAEHGHYNFRQLKSGTYDLVTATVQDVAKPFWAGLQGRGKRVAILDAFDSPAVCGLDGLQVGNLAVHEWSFASPPATAEPPELLDEARRVVGPHQRFLEYKPNATLGEERRLLQAMVDRIGRKGTFARQLLTAGRYDVAFVGFYEAHTGGHRFWRYRPEARGSAAVHDHEDLALAVFRLYETIDREIGKLLAVAPEDANVFVVSAFGMEDLFPMGGLAESFCRELGYHVRAAAAGAGFSPLDIARRLVPHALRAEISKRLPSPVQERLLADALRGGTDWSRTTAFAIPSLYTSFLRVNLSGREPAGVVAPGADYDALVARIEADLQALVDPESGERPVARVTRTAEAFGGGPPEKLPDLFVEWTPRTEYAWRLEHPRASIAQGAEDYFRESYHTYTGFVAGAGPSLSKRGELGEVELLDFTPTFLHLMGEPAPQGLRGAVSEVLV